MPANGPSRRSPLITALSAGIAAVAAAAVFLWSWLRRRSRRRHEPVPEPDLVLSGAAARLTGTPAATPDTEDDAAFTGHDLAAALEGQPPQAIFEPPTVDDPRLRGRRRVLGGIGIAAAGLGATVVGVPVIGALLYPLFRATPREWRTVGPVNQFKVGDTVAVSFDDAAALVWSGVSARTAAWLRRVDEQSFLAFRVNCTHLGCPVRWLAEASLFMCPCHGGVFYQDGTVAAGPPQHPLELYPVRVQNGQVQVRTGPIPIE
jgi:menaquinol-cytochrome c reductase iron-sulfur subunit